jgi:hypothetical protein
MKNLFLLLIIALVAFSCEKDDVKPSFRLDPTAMVYIKPELNALKSANAEHLTPIEVVKLSNGLNFRNDSIGGGPCYGGFAGKDTISETPALLMWGIGIICPDGLGIPRLNKEFIYGYDCVIVYRHGSGSIYQDTLAYIPNSQMRKAETDIINALNNQDTAAVYDIFQNAFQFLPTTGAEYRLLKTQGLN